ncbi:hypothetical protein M9458_013466, partial [Cirrhinus mrigala]
KLKYRSLKTLLLVVLTSIKRVRDLHVFSVNESCLEFGLADSHVTLRHRPYYVPKVPTTPFRDQVVNLQARPLHCCVPSMPCAFICTRSFRTSKQLFVCLERLAHWVVDAITLAY